MTTWGISRDNATRWGSLQFIIEQDELAGYMNSWWSPYPGFRDVWFEVEEAT